MVKNEWFLLLNPASGSGKGGKAWPDVENELNRQNIPFHLYRTRGAFDGIGAVQSAIENGYRKILVVGGDGTLSEAANGILRQNVVPSFEIKLGIIPVGTGNDWGRTWKLSSSVQERIKLIKEEYCSVHDAASVSFAKDGKVSKAFFMNLAGCGFDAKVALEANKEKAKGKSGVMVYISKLLSTLFSYKAVSCELLIDGKEVRAEVFAVLIGICRFAGNKMNLSPEANPVDGLLDITLVRKISRLRVVFNLSKLFNGKLLRLKEIEHFRCKSVSIASQNQLLLHADGESVGETPVEIKILPGALRLVTDEKNSGLFKPGQTTTA